MFRGSKGQEQNDLIALMKTINKNRSSEQSMYTNDLLHTIVEAFWRMHRKTIMKFVFFPFSAYVLLCLCFLPHLITEYDGAFNNSEQLAEFIKAVIVILALYLFSFEVFQIHEKRLRYFKSFTNILDCSSTILNIWLVSMHSFDRETWAGYSIELQQNLVAVAVAMMWKKVGYWMRLWESTAFFLDLISHTCRDINFLAFMLSTVLLLLTGASLFWILNTGRGNEESSILKEMENM